MGTTLRPLGPSDAGELSTTATRAFIEAYQETEAMEELEAFCRTHFNTGQVSDDLQRIDFQHVGAFLDGQMVGYLKLNLDVLPGGAAGPSGLQIHRIYVLRDFWQHKIGAALMQESIGIARARGCSVLWLVVYNKNLRAQAFYEKWGFRHTGYFDFDFNGTLHKDHLLELDV